MKSSLHHAPALAAVSSIPSGRELRAAPRVGCRIPVTVTLDGASQSTVLRDLSASGSAAVLAGPIELGQVVSLRFALAPQRDSAVTCSGLVRSVRPDAEGAVCGLEFHGLLPADRKAIAAWVRAEMSPEPGDIARNHWSGAAHTSESQLITEADPARPVLRWAPGMASLFKQVVQHLLAQDRVFVPFARDTLAEGDRVYLEVVPPSSHFVLRLLAEVVWVQGEEQGAWGQGVGLRLAELSPMDRQMCKSVLKWFKHEEERYR